MVVAYVILLVLRRRDAGDRDCLRLVWHPALFQVALYLIILSAIVLLSYTRSAWLGWFRKFYLQDLLRLP